VAALLRLGLSRIDQGQISSIDQGRSLIPTAIAGDTRKV
jgi:hypothetical protein